MMYFALDLLLPNLFCLLQIGCNRNFLCFCKLSTRKSTHKQYLRNRRGRKKVVHPLVAPTESARVPCEIQARPSQLLQRKGAETFGRRSGAYSCNLANVCSRNLHNWARVSLDTVVSGNGSTKQSTGSAKTRDCIACETIPNFPT